MKVEIKGQIGFLIPVKTS